MEVIVHEMSYAHEMIEKTSIHCVSFTKSMFEEYKSIYNACFYDMRKALEIEPYDYLHDFEQISEKANNIYVLFQGNELIGSVACYGNEVDDLIVNPRFQRCGYGRHLLLWGMRKIRETTSGPIVLHVAAWNEKAIALYRSTGFEIVSTKRVR